MAAGPLGVNVQRPLLERDKKTFSSSVAVHPPIPTKLSMQIDDVLPFLHRVNCFGSDS